MHDNISHAPLHGLRRLLILGFAAVGGWQLSSVPFYLKKSKRINANIFVSIDCWRRHAYTAGEDVCEARGGPAADCVAAEGTHCPRSEHCSLARILLTYWTQAARPDTIRGH